MTGAAFEHDAGLAGRQVQTQFGVYVNQVHGLKRMKNVYFNLQEYAIKIMKIKSLKRTYSLLPGYRSTVY